MNEMLTIAKLHWRQMLGGRRFFAILLLLLLPVLLVAAVRASGGFPHPRGRDLDNVRVFLFFLYPQLVCMLACLIDGALLVSTELEGKTLTYLFTRPVPRARIFLAKYLAGVAALAPMVVMSATLSHALFGLAGGLRTWLALAVCSTFGVAAYDAIYSVLGALVPRRAMILCLVYSGIVELGLSYFPVVLNEGTASYGLRSLGLAITGATLPEQIRVMIGTGDLGVAALRVAGVTSVALVLGLIVVSRREFVLAEED